MKKASAIICALSDLADKAHEAKSELKIKIKNLPVTSKKRCNMQKGMLRI
ncbi:MAG: hypothetical protein K8R79_11990 [Calditrichales bacterium]|nr:hypothetical protein [Calditrichales bacterium]